METVARLCLRERGCFGRNDRGGARPDHLQGPEALGAEVQQGLAGPGGAETRRCALEHGGGGAGPW
eukprot:3144215-Alexandrium_andersonii.AAC.1